MIEDAYMLYLSFRPYSIDLECGGGGPSRPLSGGISWCAFLPHQGYLALFTLAAPPSPSTIGYPFH